MKAQKLYINNIPAIVWGKASPKVYLYVHGKMSCKENAENFARIAENKGWQTISFDLPEHGERKNENYPCNIWNGIHDLTEISNYVFVNWKQVSLYACSLGAYFSLHAYGSRHFENCLFQSPIVDMEYLIHQMFNWFNITEKELKAKKEILTPIDVLSWDYYQYVKVHPITLWDSNTRILYGEKDTMQSLSVIEQFARSYHCLLTISENSEHPFMSPEDIAVAERWLTDNII